MSDGICTIMFVSPDDQALIYDFYTSWLQEAGYHYISGVRLSTDASARNFQTADCRRSVTLAVQLPARLSGHGQPPPTQPDTKTVFQVTVLVGRDPICYPEKPIPAPPPTPAPRLA